MSDPATLTSHQKALKKYFAKNKDKINSYQKSYYETNKEALQKKNRERYQKKKLERISAIEELKKLKDEIARPSQNELHI